VHKREIYIQIKQAVVDKNWTSSQIAEPERSVLIDKIKSRDPRATGETGDEWLEDNPIYVAAMLEIELAVWFAQELDLDSEELIKEKKRIPTIISILHGWKRGEENKAILLSIRNKITSAEKSHLLDLISQESM